MQMQAFTTNYAGKNFVRIDKSTARKLFNDNKTIIFCPCNLRPFTMYHPEIMLTRLDETGEAKDFDKTVSMFEGLNCINKETGTYTAFYVEEK